MSYRKEIKVRFGDIDQAGIVYYPTLVNYTHTAMEDFFDDFLAYPYSRFIAEHGLGLPTVRFEMDFKRPLRYGDRVICESKVEALGRTSVRWTHSFYMNDPEQTPVAEARTVTVCTSLENLEKAPVPDWLRERIERAQGQY